MLHHRNKTKRQSMQIFEPGGRVARSADLVKSIFEPVQQFMLKLAHILRQHICTSLTHGEE